MFEELLHRRKLPDRLVFPPAVHRQFALLWRRSVESQTEWGMTLCVDVAGKVHCRHVCPGSKGGFAPVLRTRSGERLMGVYHTHVYIGGETGIAFSDGDFAEFVRHPEVPLFVLQSGDDLFALVRTTRTASAAPGDFSGGDGQFYGRLVEHLEVNQRFTFQEALLHTNLDFCRNLAIAFYQGIIREPLEVVVRS
ncbi:MAG: hypothetical protein HY318_04720 [Armatimonadetes bacterium]|nr:hypothetical protein [Armatimonadota bacterium]